MIAVPFPFVIFLPVWLFVTSKIEKFEINNTIFVLFLLALHAVFTALLSLNVTREKIYNSLEFSKDLYSLNTNIGNHPSDAEKSAVDLSADEVIKQIEECRQLLFNRVGITREGLNDGTCNDRYFDSRNIGQQVLLVSDKLSPAMKLEGSIRSFVSEIDKIPGYQDLAKRTTDILDLNAGAAEGKTWSELMFAEDYFSWVIVNLDAIENIVRVVKMSVFTNK